MESYQNLSRLVEHKRLGLVESARHALVANLADGHQRPGNLGNLEAALELHDTAGRRRLHVQQMRQSTLDRI